MIELKDFQQKAVDSLLTTFRKLSSRGEPSVSIFKAPTGSGKTIMVAEFLKRLADEDLPENYVFVWASLYDLHSQSKANAPLVKRLITMFRDRHPIASSVRATAPNPLRHAGSAP